MSNLYYTPTDAIQPYTTAKASDLVAEFQRIEAAFDRLPEPDVLTDQNLALALLETTGATRVNTSTGQTVEQRLAALNVSYAEALSRANHTGSQAISTVTGLQAALDAKANLSGANFSGTLSQGGDAVWHAGNFNPAAYAPLAGATFAGNVTAGAGGALAQIRSDGDVKAYRAGGTTGALFLSQDNTRYLYNDGSTYHLNAQGLAVTGPVVSGGTELAKNNLNNLTGAIRTINLNYQGSGNNALIHDKTLVFAPNVAPAANDVANAMFLRQAAYSGGTPGFTNNALKVLTEVSNAGALAFEWAFLAVLDNNAAAGENTAAYMQAIKRNTGPTFANTIEVIEPTTVNNPTSGTVAQEIDVSVNGTDDNFCRIGSDLVVRKYNSGGPDAVAGYGFRIQNGGFANSLVRIGFGLGSGMKVEVGLDTALGSVSQFAVRLAANQVIAWDVSGVRKSGYISASQGFAYNVLGVDSHVHEDSGCHYMKPIPVGSLPAAGKAGRFAVVTGLIDISQNALAAGGGSGTKICLDDGGSWRVC